MLSRGWPQQFFSLGTNFIISFLRGRPYLFPFSLNGLSYFLSRDDHDRSPFFLSTPSSTSFSWGYFIGCDHFLFLASLELFLVLGFSAWPSRAGPSWAKPSRPIRAKRSELSQSSRSKLEQADLSQADPDGLSSTEPYRALRSHTEPYRLANST